MLVLPIKKRWFDMIKSGEKKEEYRKINVYYQSRFEKYTPVGDLPPEEFYVIFRNGYSKNSPSLKCEVTVQIGEGKKEWGAEPNGFYYVLKILSVEEVKNENSRRTI
ncbi:MAG: ASCH domain-containing protein [Ruminococcus sp.]|nr:ASCH domain-containing protein [Ruminococcus sp.]